MTPGPFGHDHMADRAQILLWSHAAFNRLPRHARSLDVGAFARDGRLLSLADADELFMVNEFVEGDGYNHSRVLAFVRAVLDRPRFDPSAVNEYCDAACAVP